MFKKIFFCCIKNVANRNARGSLCVVLVFSDFNLNFNIVIYILVNTVSCLL